MKKPRPRDAQTDHTQQWQVFNTNGKACGYRKPASNQTSRASKRRHHCEQRCQQKNHLDIMVIDVSGPKPAVHTDEDAKQYGYIKQRRATTQSKHHLG